MRVAFVYRNSIGNTHLWPLYSLYSDLSLHALRQTSTLLGEGWWDVGFDCYGRVGVGGLSHAAIFNTQTALSGV